MRIISMLSNSSANSRTVVVLWSPSVQDAADRSTSCGCHCSHDEADGPFPDISATVWSVTKTCDASSVASWKESHGMTRCPDGLVSSSNNLVPGDHSILYPPFPGNAMHRFPLRRIRTASFSVIESNPKIAGSLLPQPSATFA